LAEEGARLFSTARVAEMAGVSVGSLYQYFPNKRRSSSGSRATSGGRRPDLLTDILEDLQRPLLERLRALVHSFIRSECEE